MRVPFAMLMALTISACTATPPAEPADRAADPAAEPKPEPTEHGMRWITLDVDALDTARAALAERDPDAQLQVVNTWDNVAVVQFDAEDFLTLSRFMHEDHNRCGGFAVHESLTEALGALRAKDRESIAPLVAYTIDNAATVNALLPQLSKSTLLSTIQSLSAYPTRYYTSTTGGQASTWLRDRLAGYASAAGRSDVTVQLFETGWAMKSVIATIPGSTLASEVVVVGGHLDSINQSGSTAPGADDDASGIATFTETFRVLMAMNYRPLRTVKFMAYAGEEVGLLGSKQIVQSSQATGVVGVMQLDMTNYKGSTGDIYIYQDYTNAAQNTFVANLIDTYLPGVTRGTDSCGYGCSDHASWYNAGYVTSMPFESRMSQYNPYIHTANDTLDKSANDAVHALKFAKLATAYVAELAKGTLGTSGNTPPTVSITAPANGSSYPSGTAVTFTGTASDTQDGPLSGSIAWTSSISGALGTGASISRTLTAGTHTIQAQVTDSGGLSSAASITVTITGGGGGTNLLVNPGFESGAVSWTQTAGVIDNSAGVARTGSWAAWLNGYGTTRTDSIYQQVTIPSGSTGAQLCFYLRVTTSETTTTTQYDKLQVQLRNSAGTVLTTLATFSNLSASGHATYTQHCYSVGSYAGQAVRPYFLGTEDSSLKTSFYLDDTSLQ
jgi:bacterial leucyl aminopeptidase